jgi:broad specificity phosphatase PhoE
MTESKPELWLIRHGETEWSRSGAHTGRTDIPLTPAGIEQAERIGRLLAPNHFGVVVTSPLARARETCRLAGMEEAAVIDPDLREWDYGDYEGRTTSEIRKLRPEWSLWSDGVPGGERLDEVAVRAKHALERYANADGNVALFAHGHFLRVLAACWLGLAPDAGQLFALGAGSVSRLAYERDTRVLAGWNRIE